MNHIEANSQVPWNELRHMENAATLFSRSRVAWDSSTFSQNGLTNIKHYLYFFFLDLRIHESTQLPCAAKRSTPLYFPCKMRNFFWLAWLYSSVLLYFLLFLSFFFLFSFLFHMDWRFLRFFLYFHNMVWRFFCIFADSYAFIAPGPGNPGWKPSLEASQVI